MSKEIIQAGDATHAAVESLVLRGDLSGLNSEQKSRYYIQLCQKMGLDAATTPFLPLKLQGKEILYASKGCADQLRSVHNISIQIHQREEVDGVYYVYARARTPDGREDEDCGAVTIAGLKGDLLANAKMKAITKAKRRVTLSIVGLGMLDESELETVPGAFAKVPREQPTLEVVQAPVKERKSEALPPLPDAIKKIPAAILLGVKPLAEAGLYDTELVDMSHEQLELVVEAVGAFYQRYSKSKQASELGLKWQRAIIAEASRYLRNLAEPEAPPMPEHDPETGEVYP